MSNLLPHTRFEFTLDMVETARQHFTIFEEDGVLVIERNFQGLWLVSQDRRAFLGLARLPLDLTARRQ